MADNNPQLQSVDRFQKAYIEQEKSQNHKSHDPGAVSRPVGALYKTGYGG